MRVDLYDDVGTFITFANTDATGIYTFPAITDGDYVVRVVSATIGDGDTPPTTGYVVGFSSATAEQTYEFDGLVGNGGPGAMGGNDPLVDDTLTGAGAGEGDINVSVTVSGAGVAGVDLGFSFNLIVNTFDTGQGSLRQFMLNANAMSGVNWSQFNIPNTDPNFDTLYSNGYVIQSNTPLPILTNNGTSINGVTQETNQGDQRGGRPDIVLDGANLGINDYGVHIQASACTVRKIDMRQFNNGAAIGMGTAILIDGSAGGGDTNSISENYLSDNNSTSGSVGAITVSGDADNNNISNNNIRLNNSDGILVQSGLSSGTVISGNTIFANGDDGMRVRGNLLTITGNSINFNQQISVSACGMQLNAVTNSTIAFNSISNNGTLGGICMLDVASSNNIIGPNNTISGNFGPGIQIQLAGSINNTITNNTMFTNLGLGIDLNNDGVTPNDPGDLDVGPNTLLNFPVINTAQVAGGFVTITGVVGLNANVEFYEADTVAIVNGEGAIYIGSAAEGSPSDSDPAAGLFSFTLPAGSLSVGDLLTATATDDTGNTSEFALNFVVTP